MAVPRLLPSVGCSGVSPCDPVLPKGRASLSQGRLPLWKSTFPHRLQFCPSGAEERQLRTERPGALQSFLSSLPLLSQTLTPASLTPRLRSLLSFAPNLPSPKVLTVVSKAPQSKTLTCLSSSPCSSHWLSEMLLAVSNHTWMSQATEHLLTQSALPGGTSSRLRGHPKSPHPGSLTGTFFCPQLPVVSQTQLW